MEQSDLVDNAATFAMIISPGRHVLQLEFFCLMLISPLHSPTKAYKYQEM